MPRHWWLTPIIHRGLWFKGSLGKYFMRLYLKKNFNKNMAGGVAQGGGSEFKPQYHKK
jgi:hypothetical protein